jgi:outer membrane immunogenic protein
MRFSSTQRRHITLLLLIVSGASFAQEKKQWAGPHIGFSTGHTWTRDINTEYLTGGLDGFGPSGFTAKNKLRGGLVGVNAGYHFLLKDRWLLGVGAEWRAYHANKSSEQCSGPCEQSYLMRSSIKNKVSFLAKAGYLVNDKTLLFVNGGWANTQMKRRYTNIDGGDSESHKSWQGGWTVGFGGEYAFHENLTGKIEYRYTNIKDKTMYPDLWSRFEKQDANQSELTAGITYYF